MAKNIRQKRERDIQDRRPKFEGLINSNGVGIYTRVYGNASFKKPTIVFQHGVTGSGALFKGQQEFLLKNGYQSVAIDMRGGGRSDKVGPWDQVTLANDIRNVVNALNIPKPFVLVGWSYGGAISQVYYNLFPGDLIKLVLVDTTVSYVSTPEFPYAIPPAALAALIASIRADYQLAARVAINDRIISDSCRTATEELRQVAIQIALQSPEETAAGQYGAFPLFNNINNLPNINIPVLIMHGERDPIFRIDIPLFARSKIPNANLIIYDETGHSPFLTRFHKFNEDLLAFINGNSAKCDVYDSINP